MKICIVNNLYKPFHRGGSERVIELAINELIKKDQVLLLTTQPEDVKNCLVDNNLRLCRFNPQNIYYILDDYRMPFSKKIWWHFSDLFRFKIAREFKQELEQFKPDIVITHNLKGFSSRIPKIIRKLRISQIHVLHDYQLIDPHGSLYRKGQNLAQIGPFLAVYSYCTQRLIKSPNLVISPSKFVLDKHLQYGFFKRSKTEVLPNPTSIQVSSIKYQVSNKLRLLYLGQIEVHKGVEFLVKTFQKWDNPESHLMIVGDGSQLELIKKLSERNDQIEILGKVDSKKVAKLFGQADILIVPSIWWENSPTVIYEAYSYQVPVLVSDSGGSKELVKEGGTGPSASLGTGWVFKSGDENDLIRKLNHLKVIREDLKSYGQKGYEFVQQFSVDKYVNKLLELCRELKE